MRIIHPFSSSSSSFLALALSLVVPSFLGACGGDDSNTPGAQNGVDGGTSSNNDGGGTTQGDGGTAQNDSGGTTNTDSGGGPSGPAPGIGGCEVFPSDNAWNTPIDDTNKFKVHPNAAQYAQSMAGGTRLHADWGDWSQGQFGIPWQTVGAGQAKVPVSFSNASESDPGPYPFPLDAKIESGDAHVLVVDTSTCTIYETYNTSKSGNGFSAESGAKFDMKSNTLRKDGWTSADAAGLSILAGLVRLAEVQAGAIHHAIRFTMNTTQNAYIHPATHAAGNSGANLPPLGLRLRLKASFDLSPFSGPTLVILTAMKKYGLILADNGSDWFISGDSDDGWTNLIDPINQAFGKVHGSDFEAVDTGPITKAGL